MEMSKLGRETSKDMTSVEVNDSVENGGPPVVNNSAHRVLTQRQVQMYSIGATIGTAVFVSIGVPLLRGGPLFLLLGYIFWCSVIYCVNEGQAEMVCYLPIESSFSRFASRWVDEAFGVATAWNFYLCMCSLLCFEITALHTIIGFWTADLNPVIIPIACIATYAMLHFWSAKYFAESEFWIVLCKVLLMLGLFVFTFVVMLGGNPIKDRFGFRFWRDPGPISNFYGDDNVGRLRGFWSAVLNAAFAVAGPDFLSMIAGETISPRTVMPTAFKTVIVRLILFFVMSAFAVGILVPWNDPTLIAAVSEGLPGAGRSPYVAAMTRLKVKALPSVVNAGIATSVYSAGSGFLFSGSRVLHGLALDGQAPKFVRRVNRNGVPYVAVLITMAFACLTFLQVSSDSSIVLDWFINISTASQLVNWMSMAFTYTRFYKATNHAGMDRSKLPVKSWCQPYGAWYALVCAAIVTLTNGYPVFMKNGWSTPDFIFAYAAPILFVIVFSLWKVLKRTKFVRYQEADLTSGLQEIEDHEETVRFAKEAHNIYADEKPSAWKKAYKWAF